MLRRYFADPVSTNAGLEWRIYDDDFKVVRSFPTVRLDDPMATVRWNAYDEARKRAEAFTALLNGTGPRAEKARREL